MRRVVITGIGALTPFGIGVNKLWESLLSNKNAISEIKHLNICGDIVKIAGSLPSVDFKEYQKDDKSLFCKIPEDEAVKASFIAVYEALKQAGIDPRKMESTDRIGSFISDRQMGAIEYVDQYAPILAKCTDKNGILNEKLFYAILCKRKIGKKSHHDDPDSINHYFSRNYNITGMQLSPATACASGNSSIGEAFIKIKNGYIDIAIAGGAYNFDLSVMIGFTRIGALTLNPDPETACCPFDVKRSGFVMGSGCGILILEDLESAKKRRAEILCEVKGYGYYSDAYRATDPDPDARGAVQTINYCLEMAGVNIDEIGYINAHGTSTKMNDLSETKAVKSVFKDYAYKIPISSTKSMIGHSIMASAAIEAIVCIKSINEGLIHPTRNWKDRDTELDLDYVPDEPREKEINHALSNSFGFGGQNTSILLSKYVGR